MVSVSPPPSHFACLPRRNATVCCTARQITNICVKLQEKFMENEFKVKFISVPKFSEISVTFFIIMFSLKIFTWYFDTSHRGGMIRGQCCTLESMQRRVRNSTWISWRMIKNSVGHRSLFWPYIAEMSSRELSLVKALTSKNGQSRHWVFLLPSAVEGKEAPKAPHWRSPNHTVQEGHDGGWKAGTAIRNYVEKCKSRGNTRKSEYKKCIIKENSACMNREPEDNGQWQLLTDGGQERAKEREMPILQTSNYIYLKP